MSPHHPRVFLRFNSKLLTISLVNRFCKLFCKVTSQILETRRVFKTQVLNGGKAKVDKKNMHETQASSLKNSSSCFLVHPSFFFLQINFLFFLLYSFFFPLSLDPNQSTTPQIHKYSFPKIPFLEHPNPKIKKYPHKHSTIPNKNPPLTKPCNQMNRQGTRNLSLIIESASSQELVASGQMLARRRRRPLEKEERKQKTRRRRRPCG